MRKRKRQGQGEIDYWQPTSDLLISLLLVLLLVIVLLGLYLLYNPEVLVGDPWPGDAAGETMEESVSDAEGSGDGEGDEEDDYDGYGYGGGAETSPTPSPSPSPTPTPLPNGGAGDGDEPDEGIKSAVFVMLVDAETGRTVKEAGVEFELYSDDNGLQVLNTYYPEKTTYRKYETTEDGTFYLPEKIYPGGYYLHELTEISGYEMAENQYFVIDTLYDWPEPYLVEVPVYPTHNIIRVRMNDKDTGMPVTGGSFDVVAAEDIVTLDGSIRYRQGEVVDEILCDAEGYGESEELYLGDYTLRQSMIPEYYASVLKDIDVTVGEKSQVAPSVNQIACEKTTIQVILTDELYETTCLEGVAFEVTRGAGATETVVTDRNGQFLLENLDKGVNYRIRQAEPSGDYIMDTQEHVVNVGSNGRVANDAHPALNLTNRMIRVTIGMKDAILGSQITDVNLALYESGGELVRTWTTSGVAVTMNDLHPGEYYVIKDGDQTRKYLLSVKNTAELQSLDVSLLTWRSGVVIALGVLGVIFTAVVLTVLIRSAKKRRREKKESEKTSPELIRREDEGSEEG